MENLDTRFVYFHDSRPVIPKLSEGWVDFPLSTFFVPQGTLPLSKTVHCTAVVVC